MDRADSSTNATSHEVHAVDDDIEMIWEQRRITLPNLSASATGVVNGSCCEPHQSLGCDRNSPRYAGVRCRSQPWSNNSTAVRVEGIENHAKRPTSRNRQYECENFNTPSIDRSKPLTYSGGNIKHGECIRVKVVKGLELAKRSTRVSIQPSERDQFQKDVIKHHASTSAAANQSFFDYVEPIETTGIMPQSKKERVHHQSQVFVSGSEVTNIDALDGDQCSTTVTSINQPVVQQRGRPRKGSMPSAVINRIWSTTFATHYNILAPVPWSYRSDNYRITPLSTAVRPDGDCITYVPPAEYWSTAEQVNSEESILNQSASPIYSAGLNATGLGRLLNPDLLGECYTPLSVSVPHRHGTPLMQQYALFKKRGEEPRLGLIPIVPVADVTTDSVHHRSTPFRRPRQPTAFTRPPRYQIATTPPGDQIASPTHQVIGCVSKFPNSRKKRAIQICESFKTSMGKEVQQEMQDKMDTNDIIPSEAMEVSAFEDVSTFEEGSTGNETEDSLSPLFGCGPLIGFKPPLIGSPTLISHASNGRDVEKGLFIKKKNADGKLVPPRKRGRPVKSVNANFSCPPLSEPEAKQTTEHDITSQYIVDPNTLNNKITQAKQAKASRSGFEKLPLKKRPRLLKPEEDYRHMSWSPDYYRSLPLEEKIGKPQVATYHEYTIPDVCEPQNGEESFCSSQADDNLQEVEIWQDGSLPMGSSMEDIYEQDKYDGTRRPEEYSINNINVQDNHGLNGEKGNRTTGRISAQEMCDIRAKELDIPDRYQVNATSKDQATNPDINNTLFLNDRRVVGTSTSSLTTCEVHPSTSNMCITEPQSLQVSVSGVTSFGYPFTCSMEENQHDENVISTSSRCKVIREPYCCEHGLCTRHNCAGIRQNEMRL